MAHLLGGRGVPNRVDVWDNTYDHDWSTWQQMLPSYLDELTS
jgi:esterase/lipase superfamily enzyme